MEKLKTQISESKIKEIHAAMKVHQETEASTWGENRNAVAAIAALVGMNRMLAILADYGLVDHDTAIAIIQGHA